MQNLSICTIIIIIAYYCVSKNGKLSILATGRPPTFGPKLDITTQRHKGTGRLNKIQTVLLEEEKEKVYVITCYVSN